ncbi:hypothetical protein PIB30_084207 [Stylosanthes scabra]|uniref:Uncharacterized protein n=1 Tax=Stylosanthes scabra TaxID=79078 RepID=A0ABU6WU54_9FABA|nr:hypothetical protein [Stylosanthes scabra]
MDHGSTEVHGGKNRILPSSNRYSKGGIAPNLFMINEDEDMRDDRKRMMMMVTVLVVVMVLLGGGETTNPNTTNPFSIVCHPYAAVVPNAAVLFSVTASRHKGVLKTPNTPFSLTWCWVMVELSPPPPSSIPSAIAAMQSLPPPPSR